MFLRSKNLHASQRGVSHRSDPAGDELGQLQPPQWQAWRRSAQKVARAWNEWLAADHRERTASYRRYISALGEEELAANELERTISLARPRTTPVVRR